MMTLPFRAVALLQLAVVLGVAAGFGFALWQKGEPVAFDRQATGVAPSMESLPQTPSPSVSPAVDANSGNSPQTLAEWLEGEVASTSSGSEQIRGVVLLEGEPLTGLEMTASVRIPSDIDEEADLVDRLLSRVRSDRLRNSLVRICISDEEGRFSFEGLRNGSMALKDVQVTTPDTIDGADENGLLGTSGCPRLTLLLYERVSRPKRPGLQLEVASHCVGG